MIGLEQAHQYLRSLGPKRAVEVLDRLLHPSHVIKFVARATGCARNVSLDPSARITCSLAFLVNGGGVVRGL